VGRVKRAMVIRCLGRAAGRSSGAGCAQGAAEGADADLPLDLRAWLSKRCARVGWRSSRAQAMPERSLLATPSSGSMVNLAPDLEGSSVPASAQAQGAQAQGAGLMSPGLCPAAGNDVGWPVLYLQEHAGFDWRWSHGAATPGCSGSQRPTLRLGGFGVSAVRSCDPAHMGAERLSSLQSEVAALYSFLAVCCTCLPRQVLVISLRSACAALREGVCVVVYLSPVFACR
jgi:hypothetical protein